MPARKTTILTADDDPHLLRLVARNLDLEGYEVLAASDGEQALAQIEAQQPDLVLLDVMMPRMDGLAVCRRVREFSTVPIIIVTAREQDKVRGWTWEPMITSPSLSVWTNCWRGWRPCCAGPSLARTSIPM